MITTRPFPTLVRAAAAIATYLAVLLAPRLAAAQAPVPTTTFAPYIGVRQITNALPGIAPGGAYTGRQLAFDRTNAFRGIAVATANTDLGQGRIDLVDPMNGALMPLGAPNLGLPTAVAIPSPGSFTAGVYYFQQFDFPGNPTASRKVYYLLPGASSGLGTILSSIGLDSGSGLAFAPTTFGSTYGGQLFGSDSSNSPGITSVDGIRRWDAAGNFTNEVMGPAANNPDSYTDVTFTGPEFGAFSNRLVGINTTGVNGENILMWTEATLLATQNNPLGAYNAREVFAASQGDPVAHATYGAYGATGYLFAHSNTTTYRFDASGTRSAFLTNTFGFSDVEFGDNRTLYVTNRSSGLYEVRPSPQMFAGWTAATGCPVVSEMSDVIQTWQVGGACPGAPLLCRVVNKPLCGEDCLTAQQKATVIAAVAAICANPC